MESESESESGATPSAEASEASSKGARFSIVELLMAMACVGLVFGANSRFGVAAAAVVGFILSLIWLFRFLFTKRRWFALLPIFGLVASALTIGVALLAWAVFGVGPVLRQSNWPPDLVEMQTLVGGELDGVRVSGLGGFLDEAHVWTFRATPEQAARIVNQYGMERQADRAIPTECWAAFPRWWGLQNDDQLVWYQTSEFPFQVRGRDGTHFMMIHDSRSGRIYVWMVSNF